MAALCVIPSAWGWCDCVSSIELRVSCYRLPFSQALRSARDHARLEPVLLAGERNATSAQVDVSA